MTSVSRPSPEVVRVLLQYLDGQKVPSLAQEDPSPPKELDVASVERFLGTRPSKDAVLSVLKQAVLAADRAPDLDFTLGPGDVQKNGLALCKALEKQAGRDPFFEAKAELDAWRRQLEQADPPRLYAHVVPDSELTPKIALFGTIPQVPGAPENPRAPVGRPIPQLDWRAMALLDIASRVSSKEGSLRFEAATEPTHGVVYNPIVPPDQWSPDNIKEETRQKDLAAVKMVCMDPTAAGPVSAFELWTSIAFSLLRDTRTHVHVAALLTDAVHNLRVPAEDLINSRRMLQVALEQVAPRLNGALSLGAAPGDVFKASFDDLEAFRGRTPLEEGYLRPLTTTTGPLKRQIAIAGTAPSGDRLSGAALAKACIAAGVPPEQVRDLHVDGWKVDTHYEAELATKEESLVNCVFLGHENAMGCLADIGRAFLRALMCSSYQIIVLPDLAEKKPGQPGSYYRSAYGVIKEDWERLTEACPQLRHYVKFVHMKACDQAGPDEVARVSQEVASLACAILRPGPNK